MEAGLYRRFIIILILAVLTASCSVRESEPDITPSHYTSNDISNQQINSFVEDSFGHVWIGTFRGLNKFNGYEYHQYFNTDDTTSINDNQIRDMHCDFKGRLWIGTVNGISIYTNQDGFHRIPIESSSYYVLEIFESSEGRIFLNTGFDICEYVPEEDIFKAVIPQVTLNDSFAFACFIDKDNKLWVVNSPIVRCYNLTTMELVQSFDRSNAPVSYAWMRDNGELWLVSGSELSILNTRSLSFNKLPDALQNDDKFTGAAINYIHPYNDDALLINTSHGLFCFKFAENKVIHESENGFPFDPPAFKITSMFTDSQKNLWIGSSNQGFVIRYNSKQRFNGNNFLRKQLEKQSVIALKKGNDDRLWIATAMDELYMYNIHSGEINRIEINHILNNSNYTKGQMKSLFLDDENRLWLIANNKLICCKYNSINNLLNVVKIYRMSGLTHEMAQDRNGTIWAGNSDENIYALRKGADEFEKIMVFPRSITFTSPVLRLSTGEIMIAAFPHSPMIIDPDTWEITEVDVSPMIKRSQFIPICLYEDSYGDIWIGTIANGLIKYSRRTGKMESMENTTCSDISAVIEDGYGNIWVSTLFGMSRFDRSTGTFSSYYKSDGIGGNQFNERSSCQLEDGTIIFGGTHGLTLFNPSHFSPVRSIPLIFEDLKVHNHQITPGKSEIIDKSLRYNPVINLRHDQNTFSISFAALDYSENENVHYHYMMEGFDKLWINARNNREAYYSNLPSGSYNFIVKITNNDKSIIEAQNSIQVHIKRAPWLSWWAIVFYIIFFACSIWIIIKAYLEIRQSQEQIRKVRLEKEQEQRINKMNMSYFANVSHEFRTPLTLINGPITQLCNDESIQEDQKNLLFIIKRSVNRMLELINQLLDFNKLENDALKLEVRKTDVISVLNRMVELFALNAKYKNIRFKTYGLEDSYNTFLDTSKFEKITGNLISNAIKFTPVGGHIEITFDVIKKEEARKLFSISNYAGEEFIKVTVSDSGPGIPDDKLEKVFERYYQMDGQSKGVYNWGTGIGLYYARRLAELHHGYIRAISRPEGEGACFSFILPASDIAYSEHEIMIDEADLEEGTFVYSDDNIQVDNQEPSEKLPNILVVDDEAEIVHYLKTLLGTDYNIISHFDGERALKTMHEEEIDLVLCDIVMPGMSGTELCRMIKDDIQLCHIPVVLITAKATVEDQVAGLNTGANAYVTKPFDPRYLTALLKSQLSNREKTRKLLGESTKTDKIAESILTPLDKAFMTSLYQIMESELSNPELNITMMTEILKVSRTKFYNKLKSLTGMNPNHFLRTYKLNRASELLKEGVYNISEVADMTGFSTLSHFSACFKKQFGITPSRFVGAPEE